MFVGCPTMAIFVSRMHHQPRDLPQKSSVEVLKRGDPTTPPYTCSSLPASRCCFPVTLSGKNSISCAIIENFQRLSDSVFLNLPRKRAALVLLQDRLTPVNVHHAHFGTIELPDDNHILASPSCLPNPAKIASPSTCSTTSSPGSTTARRTARHQARHSAWSSRS